MPGIIHFETFLAAGILLNLTPGNDTIFILSKSIAQGKKAGIVSALGIGAGCLVHTSLASVGLSLIIARSLLVFEFIKYAGALYLLYMGYRMFTKKAALIKDGQATENSQVNYAKIFRDAMLTNILNPKVALFFIAFLPQFIDPAFRHNVLPFATLGLTFVITGTLWCTLLAIFAAAIFAKLKTNPSASAYINRVCGLMLVALGIKVALTNR